jgi:hypothetical protein
LPPLPEAVLPLRALGGLALDTRAIGFGGLSGAALAADGTLSAVSDRGFWLTARLLRDAAGAPAGLEGVATGRLRDEAGEPLPRGRLSDAEALAPLPGGGFLVAFERAHRIRRYAHLDARAEPVPAPPFLERSPTNRGLESLAVLADGRWVAIAEGLGLASDPSLRAAWLGGPAGWRLAAYRPAAGYDPTDSAGLPDGGALVLERSFNWIGGFSARLVRLRPAAFAERVWEGEELLRLDQPWPADNFEAVAVAPGPEGLLVALLSDDNESPLQRSLLLLFALAA